MLAVRTEPTELGIAIYVEPTREDETHEGSMDAISKRLDRSLLSPPLSVTSSYEGQETLTEGIATRRSNHPFSVFQH